MTINIYRLWGQPWILSVVSGILLSLSFPPIDLPILQIPAFILLFRLADLSIDWRDLATKALVSFLIWNLATTYWLMAATPAGGAAAIFANSLLMLIPLMLMRSLLRRQLHPLGKSILIGSAWVSYEFLHHHWDLAWPWLALGNGWSTMPALIQYISATGHLAISFWVVATATMMYKSILSLTKTHFIYALTLFLLFPAISVFSTILYQEQAADTLQAAVIQPNMDSYQRYGGLANVDELLTGLLELSDSARTDQTDLIVWPENAIDSAISRENRFNARIQDSLRSWNTELITGTGLIRYYDPDKEPSLVRGYVGNNSYNIFNSALHFTGEGLPDVYKKGQLVPVVERLPYAETLQKLDLFGWVNWGEIAGYGKGTDMNNFMIRQYRTPALICYDSVFPGWVGGFVRNDADFLTIITNDGWWGDTSGHIQHFAYARLRAIEFRRWVVRSANNGISGIISPDGQVQAETDYWTRTAFTHNIHPSGRQTFFARYGNWFNWLMLLGAVFSIVLLVRDK